MKHQKKISTDNDRIPWIAALLSLAAPGLGHIYCGQLVKGLVLFFASFAFAPVIVTIANNAASTAMLVALIVSLMAILALIGYAVANAAITARRIGKQYQPKEYNRAVVYLLFIVVSAAYPANLANTIRDNVLHPFKIPSRSMAPSILPGDRIFLNKAVFKTRPPGRGDVIIFPNPDDRRIYFMKRIVALPGETIEIIDNVIHINGHPLAYHTAIPSPGLNFNPAGSVQIKEEVNADSRYPVMMNEKERVNHPKTTIPHGYCFVMSDNRTHVGDGSGSRTFPKVGDSRHFGPIPLADVQGRLDYIYWSALGWTRFGKYKF